MKRHDTENGQSDSLEWEFTEYIQAVVEHAKVDYIRRRDKHKPETLVPGMDELNAGFVQEDSYFDAAKEMQFEEERLEKAFTELPLLRQQVLTYTFVHGLAAEEIARILNCSVDSVYALRSRAIKRIRALLGREAEGYGAEKLRGNPEKSDSG